MTDTTTEDARVQSALSSWREAVYHEPLPPSGFQLEHPSEMTMWPSYCLAVAVCISSLIWAANGLLALQELLMLSTL